jgi:hypothetical protein
MVGIYPERWFAAFSSCAWALGSFAGFLLFIQ